MAIFNENKLSSYFDSRDWSGAANYLSTLKAAGTQQQLILNRKIAELKRQGEIQNAILSKMNDDEQQAFHFISAINGQGAIPHKQIDESGKVKANTANIFGDAYTDIINNYKDENGKIINTINLPFKNEEELNSFYNRLNIKPIDITSKYNCNVIRDSKTGEINIQTNTNNLNLVKLFKEYTHIENPQQQSGYSISPFGNYSINSIYANEARLSDKTRTLKNKLINLYNKAEDLNNKSLDKYKFKEIEEEMYVTPYLGQGQMEAYNLVAKGQLSIDDYKKIVDERTDVYNRLLAHSDFSQYKIYMSSQNDEGNNVLKEIESNPDRAALKQQVLAAISQKRVTYSAAIHGGETGTYITLSPGIDKDGNFSKGELEQPMTIFIPGLFKSSCDEVFERDTKTLSVRDLADMKHWEYGKTLSNGEYIGYNQKLGTYARRYDANGNPVDVQVGEDYILHRLNEDYIISKSAEQLAGALNEDGTPKMTIQNGKQIPQDINALGDLLASAGVEELYPKGEYSESNRLSAKNDIYVQIMKILNWNIQQNKLNE